MKSRGAPPLKQFFLWVEGVLTEGNDKSHVYSVIDVDCTAIEAFAVVKNAPVGAPLELEIERSVGAPGSWSTVVSAADLTIASGADVGSTTVMQITALNKDDILRLNVDQIGTGYAGDNLAVFLRTRG